MSEKVIATAENGVAVTQSMIDSWCAAYDNGRLPDGYSYDGEVQQGQARLAKLVEFAAVQERIAERAARSKPWPEGKTADDLIREAKEMRYLYSIPGFAENVKDIMQNEDWANAEVYDANEEW